MRKEHFLGQFSYKWPQLLPHYRIFTSCRGGGQPFDNLPQTQSFASWGKLALQRFLFFFLGGKKENHNYTYIHTDVK